MANLEERVAGLEAQTDKHAIAVEALRGEIVALRIELRTEIAGIRSDMALRTETTAMRSEMALRSDVADLRADLRGLSLRWDRFFLWLAGTQVATLLAVVGVLAGILFR